MCVVSSQRLFYIKKLALNVDINPFRCANENTTLDIEKDLTVFWFILVCL